MRPQTTTLLVLWQDPDTRQSVPVGRLVVHRGAAEAVYDFQYLRGLERARKLGFQTFLAFPRTDTVYRSRTLFPFFQNRILGTSRPDYASYVRALGLEPPVDVVELLGRGHGRRQTDQIEVVPVPVREPAREGGGRYRTHFWVRGVRHLVGAEEAIARLQLEELLGLVPDPNNPVNPRALLVQAGSGRCLGYVPDYLLGDLYALKAASGEEMTIRVERVNPPPTPSQQRLLCRLEAPWPAGFVAFDDEELRPLTQAPPPEECEQPTPA